MAVNNRSGSDRAQEPEQALEEGLEDDGPTTGREKRRRIESSE